MRPLWVLVLVACGGSHAAAPLPTTRPQAEGTPMSGPYATLDAMPAPDELGPRTALARSLDAQFVMWGEVIAGGRVQCALALHRTEGWYVSVPFECGFADNRSSIKPEEASLTTEAGRVVARWVGHMHGENMDNEPGVFDSRDPHSISCVAAPKPACTAMDPKPTPK
jgi:hypothetical protein